MMTRNTDKKHIQRGGECLNYLVIDLEMCKVPKNYRGKNYKYASEIIQVGAVLLDEE